MTTSISARDVIDAIRSDIISVHGSLDFQIRRAAAIAAAQADDLAFCNKDGAEGAALVNSATSRLIIIGPGVPVDAITRVPLTLVVARNPRLTFMRAMARCFPIPREAGIHPRAFVHAEAKVDESAYIGPFCYIGRSTIGPGCTLHGGIFVYDGVRIGTNVTIHAGTILGADGFGYERNEDGRLEKFPHCGGIVIEDDVEIGANACVDRGTLSDTIIRRGAKIDNFVYVAHNVDVGEDAVLIAHAVIGGSTSIGNRAWVAPSACLRDQISIGEDAVVGLASCVTKSVPAGETVLGSPARSMPEYQKMLDALKGLVERSGG